LPNLVSLSIHYDLHTPPNHQVGHLSTVGSPIQLGRAFWTSVRQQCPRLKEIAVWRVCEYADDRWIQCLFEYPVCSHLRQFRSFLLKMLVHTEPDELAN
jgi:hypothetical protein